LAFFPALPEKPEQGQEVAVAQGVALPEPEKQAVQAVQVMLKFTLGKGRYNVLYI
jgi:hypothetical protein